MNLTHSVWSNYFHDLTPEERIRTFIRCGFTASELSDEDGAILLERGDGAIKEFRRLMDEEGFSFPQGHLYLKVDICAPESVDVLKKWLDMFSVLGIRSAVLHAAGGAGLTREKSFEKRVWALYQLDRYIKGRDLTICLENLFGDNVPWSSFDLFELIYAVGGDNLGICLDTGHLNVARKRHGVTETQRDFILNAGSYLKALHIADNDSTYDQHLMPFGRGTIDWIEVMRTLQETGYNRLFNLEIPGESQCPMEMRIEKLAYIRKLCDFMCRSF